MSYKKLAHVCAGVLLSLGLLMPAMAGISVGGTRVIYEEAKREASIAIRNLGTAPYVVQTWIDTGEKGAKKGGKAPLIVTPPLSRLDAGKENILRIVRGSGALPHDRESVLWLNVKEIPTKAKEKNVLQVALRTRIKVFYRPVGMPKFDGGSLAAPAALKWALMPVSSGRGVALKVTNPSPYHITFAALTIKGAHDEDIDVDMVPPLSEVSLPLPSMPGQAPLKVIFSTINDYGAEVDPKEITVRAADGQAAPGL